MLDTGDAFDRLYRRWAEYALSKNLDPPARERWDLIVWRLVSSLDPNRIVRYSRIDADGPDSLGADAYELWSKTPTYTPGLSIKAKTMREVGEYEQRTRGSMRVLLESKGQLDLYERMLQADATHVLPRTTEEQARARKAQIRVLTIGCIGISIIVFMALTVLLIAAVKLL